MVLKGEENDERRWRGGALYWVKGKVSQKEKAFLISTNCNTRCVPFSLPHPFSTSTPGRMYSMLTFFSFFVLFDDDMRYAKYLSCLCAKGRLLQPNWRQRSDCVLLHSVFAFFPFFLVSLHFLLGEKWSFGKSRTSIYDKTRTCNFSIKVIPKYQATCMYRDVNKQNM